ncbi:MAG: GNAT family N-acetyltransferase [Sulfitobacter sp.]|nr:GNAT family N-acetyltransferase [Sulfitobacter sp.]
MIDDGLHDVPPGKVVMVVTHLQMMSPATLRGVPLPDGLTFRRVEPDLDWYRDTFDRVGAEWLWFGRRVLPDAELEQIIKDPRVALYTLEKEGRAEALLELDFRQPGECELAYFGVTGDLIGSGAGGYLMDRAIETAWDAPIDRFHVHTCTIDSPQALGFYMRSGFTAYRRQVEIDHDPRLTGMLPSGVGSHYPVIKG